MSWYSLAENAVICQYTGVGITVFGGTWVVKTCNAFSSHSLFRKWYNLRFYMDSLVHLWEKIIYFLHCTIPSWTNPFHISRNPCDEVLVLLPSPLASCTVSLGPGAPISKSSSSCLLLYVVFFPLLRLEQLYHRGRLGEKERWVCCGMFCVSLFLYLVFCFCYLSFISLYLFCLPTTSLFITLLFIMNWCFWGRYYTVTSYSVLGDNEGKHK